MMTTTNAIEEALRTSLNEIDMQIKHVKNDIARYYPEEQREKINVWYWTQTADGKYVLADLLVARAGVISAMANLKAADLNSKNPQPRKR